MHLSGRERRRGSVAQARRDVSGSGAFSGRIFFNQAAALGARHARADRGGARLVHGRQRLRAYPRCPIAIIVRNQGSRMTSADRRSYAQPPARRWTRRRSAGRTACSTAARGHRLLRGKRHARARVQRARRHAPASAGGDAAAAARRADYDPLELYGIIPQSSRKPPTTCASSSRAWSTGRSSRRISRRSTAQRSCATSPRSTACSSAHPRKQRDLVLPKARSRARTSSRLCCRENIPLVFLQTISGFMVHGQAAEAVGIAKDERQARRPPWLARRCPSTPW